jgi:uracil-DNA glycosylase family 4
MRNEQGEDSIVPHGHPRSQELIQYLQSLRAAGVTEIPRVDVEPSVSWTIDSSGNQTDSNASSKEAGLSPARVGGPSVSAESAGHGSVSMGQGAGVIQSQVNGATAGGGESGPSSLTTDAYPDRVEPERVPHALEVLAEEVSQCVRCPDLAKLRSQTVFGEGNPQARVVFFGEAPGADEDRQGEPFVGKAGQLLDRILAASTFQRDQVYILNTLKCRPPGNRNPNDWELQNCCQFWQRQLELIQPEYIVCLGAIAVRTLLQVESSIARLRGSFHRYRDSKVVVTYHPAYLLRHESAKRLVW